MRALALLLLATTAAAEPLPYLRRVEEFWKWFQSTAPARLEKLSTPRYRKVVYPARDVHDRLDAMCREFRAEYLPAAKQGERTMAVYAWWRSGDLLAKRLVESAPELDGWRVLDHLPPSDRTSIAIGEVRYHAKDFAVQLRPDPANRRFDLRIHHPMFGAFDEERDRRVCLYWLDSALGTRAARGRVGEILVSKSGLKGRARAMDKLRANLAERCGARGWNLDPDATEIHVPRPKGANGPAPEDWLCMPVDEWPELERYGVRIVSVALFDGRSERSPERVEAVTALARDLRRDLAGHAYLIGASHGGKRAALRLLVFDWDAAKGVLRNAMKEREGFVGARVLDRKGKRLLRLR